jgi:hypothetical protein
MFLNWLGFLWFVKGDQVINSGLFRGLLSWCCLLLLFLLWVLVYVINIWIILCIITSLILIVYLGLGLFLFNIAIITINQQFELYIEVNILRDYCFHGGLSLKRRHFRLEVHIFQTSFFLLLQSESLVACRQQ